MFLSLSGRSKFGFLNGSISVPDPSSPLFNTWHRANTTILSWLTISLSKELVASVIYINTARDLWLDMENRFSQGNATRFFELKKEIALALALVVLNNHNQMHNIKIMFSTFLWD